MALSPLSVQARLTRKFYNDVQLALEPLLKTQSYAINLELVIEPKMMDKLKRLSENTLNRYVPNRTLPGVAVELHTKNIQDLIGLNARDEDLIPYIQKVNATIVIDKKLEGTASAKLVADTVQRALDPLRTRQDGVALKYEDLSAILRMNMQATLADSGADPGLKLGAGNQAKTSYSQIFNAGHDGNDFWATPAFAALILVLGSGLLIAGLLWRLKDLRLKFAHTLDSLALLPTSITESIKALVKAMQTAQATAAKTAATAKPAEPAAAVANPNASIPRAPSALPAKPTDTPIAIEKQATQKRKELLANPEAFARVLAKLIKANKDRTDLTRLVKTFTPQETQMLSQYLATEELESLAKLALNAAVKNEPPKLIAFLDKMLAETSSETMLSGPVLRLHLLLEALDLTSVAAIFQQLGPEAKMTLVQTLDSSKREKFLKLLSEPERDRFMLMAAKTSPQDSTRVIHELALAITEYFIKTNQSKALLTLTAELRYLLPAKEFEKMIAKMTLPAADSPKETSKDSKSQTVPANVKTMPTKAPGAAAKLVSVARK